jgi:outer membrane protein
MGAKYAVISKNRILQFNRIVASKLLHSQLPNINHKFMKNVGTILSGLALAGVAILFYLHFGSSKAGSKTVHAQNAGASPATGAIAYFEMDSIEQHYDYVKEVREELKRQETNITNELNNLKKSYMGRVQQLQEKAPSMNQQEGEAAQAEINQMQLTLQQKEAKLAQELQEKQFKMMQEINNKISDFLKSYNAGKRYSFILSHAPGDFIYFADTTYNITNEVIKGLNQTKQKKD